jgi:hypothetical protein
MKPLNIFKYYPDGGHSGFVQGCWHRSDGSSRVILRTNNDKYVVLHTKTRELSAECDTLADAMAVYDVILRLREKAT